MGEISFLAYEMRAYQAPFLLSHVSQMNALHLEVMCLADDTLHPHSGDGKGVNTYASDRFIRSEVSTMSAAP